MLTDGQTFVFLPKDNERMKTPSVCDVVYAERIGADVIIGFGDGKVALYSAMLLRSVLDEATPLDGLDEGIEPSMPSL